MGGGGKGGKSGKPGHNRGPQQKMGAGVIITATMPSMLTKAANEAVASLNEWTKKIRKLEKEKKVEDNELETVVVQRRCIRAKQDLSIDHVITTEDVISLRPAPKNSFEPHQLKNILGKKTKRKMRKGEHFTINDT